MSGRLLSEMSIWIVFAALAIGSTGCVNPYATFYLPRVPKDYPPSNLVEVADYTPSRLRLEQGKGAVLLGSSVFRSRYWAPILAIKQAEKVGANLLLLHVQYVETNRGAFTMPLYHPGDTVTSTTYDSGVASAYGDCGYVNASYSGTSTTYATTPGYTTYHSVPYSIEIYNHAAYFLRDEKRAGLIADE